MVCCSLLLLLFTVHRFVIVVGFCVVRLDLLMLHFNSWWVESAQQHTVETNTNTFTSSQLKCTIHTNTRRIRERLDCMRGEQETIHKENMCWVVETRQIARIQSIVKVTFKALNRANAIDVFRCCFCFYFLCFRCLITLFVDSVILQFNPSISIFPLIVVYLSRSLNHAIR